MKSDERNLGARLIGLLSMLAVAVSGAAGCGGDDTSGGNESTGTGGSSAQSDAGMHADSGGRDSTSDSHPAADTQGGQHDVSPSDDGSNARHDASIDTNPGAMPDAAADADRRDVIDSGGPPSVDAPVDVHADVSAPIDAAPDQLTTDGSALDTSPEADGVLEAAPNGPEPAIEAGPVIPDVVATDDVSDALPAQEAAPEAGVSFASVVAIFNANCIGCHTGNSPAGGLNLNANPSGEAALYQRIAAPTDQGGTALGGCTGFSRAIVPGDLTQSVIYLKITGTQPMPGCGVQMPRGCMPANGDCLSEEDIATIRDWILQGAPGP
jgi:mono/diheme cytochrome c family protein